MRNARTTGAHEVCRALVDEGVDLLFGHPGGAILPLYDALHEHPRLRHVLVRHEQAAAHAADGYARATGRTGVCLATSGPGATNLVTGLATSFMDSVPVVAITGQVPTGVMGTDAFQETDILGITMAVTKHGFLVQSAAEVVDVLREAFRIARSGRPGPVLVDLPKDVQTALLPVGVGGEPAGGEREIEERAARGWAGREREPAAGESEVECHEAISRVAALLAEARRPVVIAGRGIGISGTSELLRTIAERHRLPVVTTLLGLDTFSRNHPLALGMPGMHGTPRANRAIQEADVVVGLGLRFDDRVTGPVASFAPKARIALFEIDPAAVGRTVTPDVSVVGDLADTLPVLADQLSGTVPDAWWTRLCGWSREAGAVAGNPSSSGSDIDGRIREAQLDAARPTGREAARALARAIDSTGAQVATDVGQHQMWMAQELKEGRPGTHLTSGGLGTMGYALPAAIGAALGRKDRRTWAVAGDGGFQMTLQELATVVQEGIPLRMVVVNNGYLGMVRQWQELFFEKRYAASCLSGPDFAALARAYGVPARTVNRRDELGAAIRWADAATGPVVLDLRVRIEDNVYPIVPPGAALHELVEEPVAATAAPREAVAR
jgi:acetolactate synthase I/II/III large subunit